MHKSVTKALAQEAMLRETLAALKNDIRDATRNSTPLEGVVPRNASFSCAIVSLSAIKNNDFILSPSFYMQDAQADLVARKLTSAKSVTEFIDRIQEMVNEKRARFSDGSSFRLNDRTVAVLESYL